jgi:hypothetical protein
MGITVHTSNKYGARGCEHNRANVLRGGDVERVDCLLEDLGHLDIQDLRGWEGTEVRLAHVTSQST